MGFFSNLLTFARSRDSTPAPKQKEQTGAQLPENQSRHMNLGGIVGGESVGFNAPPKGTWKTYREIARDATVALAMSKAIQSIVNNHDDWVKRDKDVPDEWVEVCKQTFDPMRRKLIRDASRGIWYGFAPFEIVWGSKEITWRVETKDADGKPIPGESTTKNYIVPTFVKPLLVDRTEFVQNKKGQILGIENKTPQGTTKLDWNYAFVFTNDSEAGDPYGRGRFENIREDWDKGEQAGNRLAQYLRKIAGVLIVVHYPDGQGLDASGSQRPNYWLAKNLAEDVANGKSLLIPNKFMSMVNSAIEGGAVSPAMLEKALGAAGLSDWTVSFMDPGGTDYADGILQVMEYYDKRKVRGLFQPERSLLEGEHGNKSDAISHGKASPLDSETIDAEIAEARNAQLVDRVLANNFGDKAIGTVKAVPQPLVDDSAALNEKITLALIAAPTTAVGMAKKIDVDKTLDSLSIPVNEESRGQVEITLPPDPVAPEDKDAKPDKSTKEMSREDEDVSVILSRWMPGETWDMSGEELEGGEWRTINGAHVYIKDGRAIAGPKNVADKINGKDKVRQTPPHLIGKTHAEIESHGKTTDKPREGFHRIDRDANGNYVGTRDEKGKIEHIAEHAERVKAAKFAPGYKAAHLAKDPNAELQAIAIDSKERPQYKYSDVHNEEAKAGKFARGKEFNRKLPEIRERLKADAAAGGKGSEEAHALRLIDHTGFRIGGEADTGAEKQAYGATTLEGRHVKNEGGKTKVEFVGKKGVDNSHEIHDPEIADELNRRAKAGGKLYNINDAKVRDYLHSIAPGFKVKDFRTAVAYRTAAHEIEGMPTPKTVKDFVAARGKVAEIVSHKLGNTPAVALKDYIDPTVFNKWTGMVANSEQSGLIAEHAKATGLKENEAAKDWIAKNAKKYREDFNKRISKNAAPRKDAA